MADKEIAVKIEAKTGGVEAGIATTIDAVNKLRESVEKFTGPVGEAIGAFKKLGEAFLIFEAVEKMGAFIEKLEDMATSAMKLSVILGATVEEVSAFRGVLIAVGGNDAGNTIRTMEHLQKTMSEGMADGTSQAARAFKNLGITTQQLQGNMNNFTGMMEILRKSFQDHADGANKTAAFYAILGRQFDTLIPVLKLTDEEFAKQQKIFAATGSNIGQFSERLFKSGEILRTFEQALTGVSLQLYDILQPAMDGFISVLTSCAEWLRSVVTQLSYFISYNSTIRDMASAFSFLAISVKELLEPFAKLFTLFGELAGNAAVSIFLKTITVHIQALAVGAAVLSMGLEGVRIAFQKMSQSNAAADAESKLIMQRNLVEWEQAVARERDQNYVKAAELGKKLIELDSQIGKAHAEAAAIAAENVNAILEKQVGAYEKFAARVKGIIAGATGGQGYGGPDPVGAGNTKPTPPPLGKGGGKGETENYMQEWKHFLQAKEMAEEDYYKNSKAGELKYWEEKVSWVHSNQAKIVGALLAAGYTKVEADKKFKDLEFQTDSEVFAIKKEMANRQLSLDKQSLDLGLEQLKSEYDAKRITEADYYAQSIARMEAWKKHLQALRLEGSEQWIAAQKQEDALTTQHVKAQQEVWASFFSWIDSKFDSVVNGILQGTTTWEKAWKNIVSSMASAFITDIAKMMLKWTAFMAMKGIEKLFGMSGGISGAIGNPVTGVMDFFGKAFGGGGKPGGGDDKATTANTAATTANTIATKLSNTSLTSWISKAGHWIAVQLGLTEATSAQTTSTDAVSLSADANAVSTDANTVSTDTAAISSDLLAGSVDLSTVSQDALAAADLADTVALYINTASNLVPLATGAWQLPQDMPAQLHKGEMVVPAGVAETLRNGGGLNWGSSRAASGGASMGGGGGGAGGAGPTIINISAVDAKSFQTILRTNSSFVSDAIAKQVRNGDRTLASAMRGR